MNRARLFPFSLFCFAFLIGCSDSFYQGQKKEVILGAFTLPNNFRILIRTDEGSLEFKEGYYIYEYVVEGGKYQYRYWLNKELHKGQFDCKVIDDNGVQYVLVSIKPSPMDPIIALNLDTGEAFDTATGPIEVFGKIPEDLVARYRESESVTLIKDESQ